MKLIPKNPLKTSSKITLIAIVSGVVLLPIIPLGARSAWIYSSQPEFCVSCHVMKTEYQNWSHSSHRHWVGCGGCHLPQKSVVTQFAGKTRDGIHHIYAYIFASTRQIRISEHGNRTVFQNCLRCHESLVAPILHQDHRKCWECHRGIPHGY